jgi:shikimate dehydrogenase
MRRPYAEVIGDPIGHSKSPTIHGFWLERLGIDAEYRAAHVLAEDLAGYVARRRADPLWRGCNVTIPHKQAIAPLLDARDGKASAIGAVNTVVRHGDGKLVGTNTDVDGVAAAVGGLDLAGRLAVVIGAGGAARAAFAYLAGQGCAVRVLARSPEKAQAAAGECGLAAEVVRLEPGGRPLAGAALVINATQLGMAGQAAMPGFVLDALGEAASDALVFDMVYAPLETDLLAAARSRGLRTADGLLMLVGQAATAFERFFDRAPPREDDAELRARLAS